MLSVAEIRNVKFAKSMSGYKQEEVDILLDKIEADYIAYDCIIKDFKSKVEELNKELEELKASQSSIQNVLLSAQSLADRIVGEAKAKSEEIIKNAESNISIITAHEKELSSSFEFKAQQRKEELEKELANMVKTAKLKADSITVAAEDSVARQQVLFDKLKMEVSGFKMNVTSKYKEQLEILNSMPDSVPSDPKQIAKIISATIDKAPDAMSFIKSNDSGSDFSDLSSASKESNSQGEGFLIKAFEDIVDEEEA